MIHDEKKIEELLSTHTPGESMRECAERGMKQYAESVASHIRKQTIEEMGRKIIQDIAPKGVTGGMIAVTKKAFNGKNKFPVLAVDFEHDLVAIDNFEDINNPTWYRAEELSALNDLE